ncbi:hypothetical protein LSTR_LSTR001906 [Laodelphax striatellus]|uniref:Uncharacterized protein n=1 Tax=Laodelphax striatellus TaxID=195883 RepID=A0A482WGM4_LAOST|nr:hypothetical protein LSTR_LSTR001906 [Laodelphax striatellus]
MEPVVTSISSGGGKPRSKDKVMTRLKFHEKMIDYLKHYCNHTTLHGFSYLVATDLGFTARCFWFLVMTISGCLMVVTVNNQILNFINNPIIMAHNGKTLKMNDIPFPALSFCSDNQIKPSYMNLTKLFSKRGNYSSTDYTQKFEHLSRRDYWIKDPGTIWNPEEGYTSNRTDIFPWRMQGGSLSRTVRFILDLDANDMQDFCTLGGRGFLVKGYNPAEQPSLTGGIAYAQVDQMTIIEVVPELITTSDNLKSWSPQKRGCYYNHERKLKMFSLYTYNNCETECIVNITINRCKCATNFLPHFGSQRSCGVFTKADMECVKRIYYSGSANISDDIRTQYSSCNCLPSCVELKYNFKVTDMPWNFSSLETKFKKKSSFVGLHITYKGGSVNVIERDCVYTFSSLIAASMLEFTKTLSRRTTKNGFRE